LKSIFAITRQPILEALHSMEVLQNMKIIWK